MYVMYGRIICGSDEDFEKHKLQGALPTMVRLQRQISYFGDGDSLRGLMRHVGDGEFNVQILGMLWEDRSADCRSYAPFSEWPISDNKVFNDLRCSG